MEFVVPSREKSLEGYNEWADEFKKEVGEDLRGATGKSVFRSWAIPKAEVPKKIGSKVLMMETADHSMEYGRFEGEIPRGTYGAGIVEIYDKGNYRLLDYRYDSKYVIEFDGNKIKGAFAMIKFKPEEKSWLFVKMLDKKISEYEDRIKEKRGKDAQWGNDWDRIIVPGDLDISESVSEKEAQLPLEEMVNVWDVAQPGEKAEFLRGVGFIPSKAMEFANLDFTYLPLNIKRKFWRYYRTLPQKTACDGCDEFKNVGGGCCVGDEKENSCDDCYQNEKGEMFTVLSKSEIHFRLPRKINLEERVASRFLGALRLCKNYENQRESPRL